MKRNGKIAHLPENIRVELNIRMRDGQSGLQLVEWLNGLPEVQIVMSKHFGGRPLTQQNISEWRQGGYKEWLDNLDAIPARRAELEREFHGHLREALRNYVEGPLVKLLGDVILSVAHRAIDDLAEIGQQQGNSSNTQN